MKSKITVKVFKPDGGLLKETRCKNFTDMEEKFPAKEVKANMEKAYKYNLEAFR
jgi:hypothetical protein